jgi:hypothetical protein
VAAGPDRERINRHSGASIDHFRVTGVQVNG